MAAICACQMRKMPVIVEVVVFSFNFTNSEEIILHFCISGGPLVIFAIIKFSLGSVESKRRYKHAKTRGTAVTEG